MNDTFEPACRRMEWLDPFYRQVWEKAFSDGIPISGTFELTPRCNFNCKMCYVHLKEKDISRFGNELSAKEWLRIAKEAKEAGTVWLCITGGEPTLHPEFKTIWTELSKMGFYLTLQTNASTITGGIAELLEKYPPRRVKITLYGTNNDVYRDVCGVENGFSRVNDGIHTLMSLGIPVELVSTVIQQNEEDAQNMAFYAFAHQLPWISTNSIKNSLRHSGTAGNKVAVNRNRSEQIRTEIEHRVDEKRYFDRNRKPCTYCRDYRVGYWILWNGTMSFCSFLDQPRISVINLPFRSAWEQLLAYEETLQWPQKCKTCSAFDVCAKCAATVSTTSNHDGYSDDEYCTIMQSEYKKIKDEEKERKIC